MRNWLGGALALTGLLVLIGLFVLWQYPAQLITYLAQELLDQDLAVGQLEYRIADGRLLCHVQQITYRQLEPAVDLHLDHFAIDIDLASLQDRRLQVNELVLVGAKLEVDAARRVPKAPSAKSKSSSASRWTVDLRGVQARDLELALTLAQVPRRIQIEIDQYASGRRQPGQRWVQVRGAIDDLPLKIDGEALFASETLRQLEPALLALDVNFAGVLLQAHGPFDPLSLHGATNLQIELDATSLPRLAELLNVPFSPWDSALFSARLTDAGGTFNLQNVDLKFRSQNSAISLSGSVAKPFGRWQPDLAVDARIGSMREFLSYLHVAMPVDFSAQVSGHLTRNDEFLQLGNATGGVTFVGQEVPGVDQFSVAGATIRLTKDEIHGWTGPFELPLEVTQGALGAALVMEGETLLYQMPLRKAAMRIRADGMDLDATAAYKQEPVAVSVLLDQKWGQLKSKLEGPATRLTIDSDFRRPGLPLEFTLGVEDTQLLNRWLQLDFPQAIKAQSSGRIDIAGGAVTLHDLRVAADYGGAIRLHIPRYDFSADAAFTLNGSVNIPSLARIAPLLDDVQAYASGAQWRGALVDLATNTAGPRYPAGPVDRMLVDELRLRPWLEGALNTHFNLGVGAPGLSFDDLDFTFKGDNISVSATGHLTSHAGMPDADLHIAAELAPGGLLDLSQALTVKGKVTSLDNTLIAQGVEVRNGASTVLLHATLGDPFGQRPRLVSALNANYWDIEPLLALVRKTSVDKPTVPPRGEDKVDKQQLLFSDAQLDLSWLERLDAFVSVDIDELALSGFSLEHTRFDLNLHDGNLTIGPLSTLMLDGYVVAGFSRRYADNTNYWQLQLVADDLDLAYLASDEEKRNRGLFSARVNLDSRGNSQHEIMSHLSGRVTEYASDMVLQGFELDKLAPDFLRQTLELLNPFKREPDGELRTDIECQLGHAVFGDGLMLMDRSLLARTPKATFMASWYLDFVSEQQRAQLVPKLRKGITLGAQDLARTLAVTGTLMDPDLQLDAGGLLMVGAGSAALYATGGWLAYYAWKQIERTLSSPDACEQAAEGYMSLDRADLALPVRKGVLGSGVALPKLKQK
jgi:hypothetical protein